MARIIICKKCGETEMEYAKTGASIDGVYHCQACYEQKMDEVDFGILNRP